MTLDAIRKSILSDAEAKASAIDSDAAKEAGAVVKEAEEKAKEIINSAEADASKEGERIRKEAEAGAEIEASSMLLEARGEVTERGLRKVMSRLESQLSKSSMEQILQLGLKQFKEIAGDGEIVIRTSKRNAGLLKGTRYRVEYEDIDGFVLATADGKIALNATIGSISERQADAARKMISDKLFGSSAARPARKKAVARKRVRAKAKARKGKKRG